MKNKRLLDSMNLLDDKYIDEANPQNKRKRRKIKWVRFGTLAACICLMITAINLFLFIPFKAEVPDVSAYESSEYFPIIEKLNMLSAVKPKYKNNFDKIFSSLSVVGGAFDNKSDVDLDASIPENAPTDSPDGSGDFSENGSYTEVYYNFPTARISLLGIGIMNEEYRNEWNSKLSRIRICISLFKNSTKCDRFNSIQ